jgi:hypothetical protein
MAQPVPLERWAAARAVFEGAPPIPNRVAAMLGVQPSTLARMKAKEGWRSLDWRRPELVEAYEDFWRRAEGGFLSGGTPPSAEAQHEEATREDDAALEALDGVPSDQLAARLVDLAARSAARILMRVDARGGVLSKSDADALSSIARLSERMEGIAREQGAKDREKSDAELADILQRVENRIRELAEELAERLVAKRTAA